MKIIESRQIRATSVGYLNDTKERDLFLEAATARIDGFLKKNPDVDEALFNCFFESRADDAPLESPLPFTASFCREKDSLPQWRAYCAGGNGVSIGFKVSCLEHVDVAVDDSFVNDGDYDPLLPLPMFGAVEYLGKFSEYQLDKELRSAVDKVAS
ncbi:MAG: DUF2971 domain-containing protein, partial [Acidobacteriota bacterium]